MRARDGLHVLIGGEVGVGQVACLDWLRMWLWLTCHARIGQNDVAAAVVDMSGNGMDMSGSARREMARVHPRNDPKFRGGVLFYR